MPKIVLAALKRLNAAGLHDGQRVAVAVARVSVRVPLESTKEHSGVLCKMH